MPPWQPSWNVDRRFNSTQTTALVNHYVTASSMPRQAHEPGPYSEAACRTRPPISPAALRPGPPAPGLQSLRALMNQVVPFITNTYIPDAQALAATYSNYKEIGRGYGNLLAFGVFDLNSSGSSKLLRRGQVANGSTVVQPVNLQSITEQVNHSWYAGSAAVLPVGDDLVVVGANSHNPAAGKTQPVDPAPKPRLIPGSRRRAMATAIRGRPPGPHVGQRRLPRRHFGHGPAPGPGPGDPEDRPGHPDLGEPAHYQRIGFDPDHHSRHRQRHRTYRGAPGRLGPLAADQRRKISRYQIVTPTCWNASPRDNASQLGPIEKALIGTPVKDVEQPIEVLRVIHSFDPCLSCAVHVMRPEAGAKIFRLNHYHGEGEIHSHDHDHHEHSHDHPQEQGA